MPVERLAELLDPRHLVDGGADDREIQPVRRADIAVKHFADMQREIDFMRASGIPGLEKLDAASLMFVPPK